MPRRQGIWERGYSSRRDDRQDRDRDHRSFDDVPHCRYHEDDKSHHRPREDDFGGPPCQRDRNDGPPLGRIWMVLVRGRRPVVLFRVTWTTGRAPGGYDGGSRLTTCTACSTES